MTDEQNAAIDELSEIAQGLKANIAALIAQCIEAAQKAEATYKIINPQTDEERQQIDTAMDSMRSSLAKITGALQ